MSENYAFLPHFIAEEIYLVKETNRLQTDTVEKLKDKIGVEEEAGPDIVFLGGNKKQVVLLVDHQHVQYISDEQEKLLVNILGAVNLKLEDVALVNLNHYKVKLSLSHLKAQAGCNRLIAFGVAPEALHTVRSKVSHEVFEQNNIKILFTYSLEELMESKEKKRSLWSALKLMFNL